MKKNLVTVLAVVAFLLVVSIGIFSVNISNLEGTNVASGGTGNGYCKCDAQKAAVASAEVKVANALAKWQAAEFDLEIIEAAFNDVAQDLLDCIYDPDPYRNCDGLRADYADVTEELAQAEFDVETSLLMLQTERALLKSARSTLAACQALCQ